MIAIGKGKTMNTNQSPVKIIFKVVILLSVSLMVSGCGTGQLPGPTITTTLTHTPIPTATSTQTPTLTPTTTPTVMASPTPIANKLIFSDTFEDNSNCWDLADFIKIKDGLMQLSTGGHQLAAIKTPIDSTPNDVMIQVDIHPNPPAGTDPSTIFSYGVGCRLNAQGSDFYFFGVSPILNENRFFMATFFQFKEAKQVDYQLFPIELPKAQNGDGFTATFLCSGNKFMIIADGNILAVAINNDFGEGDLFLGMYQPDAIAGSVNFDNLIVSEIFEQ